MAADARWQPDRLGDTPSAEAMGNTVLATIDVLLGKLLSSPLANFAHKVMGGLALVLTWALVLASLR